MAISSLFFSTHRFYWLWNHRTKHGPGKHCLKVWNNLPQCDVNGIPMQPPHMLQMHSLAHASFVESTNISPKIGKLYFSHLHIYEEHITYSKCPSPQVGKRISYQILRGLDRRPLALLCYIKSCSTSFFSLLLWLQSDSGFCTAVNWFYRRLQIWPMQCHAISY